MGDSKIMSMGLQFKDRKFMLNGKEIWIMSGAMHYFRVMPEYWRDRMLKMKAGGLNTIETYVSWNLHEPEPGHFDFEGMLDLRRYIELAQELGLYVIFRPGPYICSEWDFGGMPSWLLKDPNMKVRSNYEPYQAAVKRFFNHLLPMIEDLQATRGGPIIMVQVENEYGSYHSDVSHLHFIADLLRHHGVQELLITSDNEHGMARAPFFKVALPTANLKKFDIELYKHITEIDSNFPFMVMEYWSGWFDHWAGEHKTETVDYHEEMVIEILKRQGSINFYMYHGGTNFGFMAGANYFGEYKADVTSYDYDAPLSEAGDLTPKYDKTRQLILEYVLKPQGITSLPDPPPNSPKNSYGTVEIKNFIPWNDILQLVTKTVQSQSVVTMEMLDLGNGYGQSYGYIVYRKTMNAGKHLSFTSMNDRAQVFVNSREVAVFETNSISLEVNTHIKQNDVVDIIVENLGRVNYIDAFSDMLNQQRKGLHGSVSLDNTELSDWKIFSLDFDKDFIKRVSSSQKWEKYEGSQDESTAGLYRSYLTVNDKPQDTFLKMKGWSKGIAIINGFNLGRYWNVGPQLTLFVPAPVLKTGQNEVVIFEQHKCGSSITFQDQPELGITK
ncbi:hypothetical protein LOTGIDRAFT_224863 [Lottia gigantea]|uniref:Beta-galactosidase n=1 Tax=Lottia gigantea TaxID=225164 RepID=V4B9X3_LOTGI|nr:hypothetical protein LOTGIDRAFT_224863 [Lottia gigantea]ESP02347.1 hypothetical protein LOTGIDRAFT_224863 [Lottia gigantea]